MVDLNRKTNKTEEEPVGKIIVIVMPFVMAFGILLLRAL